MRTLLITAAVVIPLAGIVGTGLAANTDTAQVEHEEVVRLGGRVFSVNEAPTEAAIVLAIAMPSEEPTSEYRPMIRAARTDSRGQFQFFDLPPGRYVFLAIHGHHSPGRSAPVVVGELPSPFPLRITLGGQHELI